MASLVPTPYSPEPRLGISPLARGAYAAPSARRARVGPRVGGAAASVGDEDRAEPAHVGHPAFGQAVGGDGRRHAIGVRRRENLAGRVVDPGGTALRPLEDEAGDLVRDLDDAAGVHDVIRRV